MGSYGSRCCAPLVFGLPIGHTVMWLCGTAGMRIVARRYTIIGHVVLWCTGTSHLAVGFVFTSYWFLVFFGPIAIGN